jgi:hypothetical protein
MNPLAVLSFCVLGVLAGNAAVLLALNARPVWLRVLALPGLLVAWLSASLLLDPDWPRAALAGHALAVAVAMFVVFGFPGFMWQRWLRS